MKRECRLPAEPSSVGAARAFVTEAMVGQPQDAIFRAELLVSELATNCVIHAATSFSIVLTIAGRALRVEVSDDGAGRPVLGSPASNEPHGRGLRLVDTLSTSWGIASSPRRPGKTLWFSLLTAPQVKSPQARRSA